MVYNLKSKLGLIDKTKLTEEATKFYFVAPFFIHLEYDMFNPLEVIPEYSPRYYKTNEKVDFAFLFNEIPRVFVEVKRISEGLTEKNINWLAKYFNAEPSVDLAILTNGEKYWFFSDLVHENIMDKEPFYVFDLNYFTSVDLYLLGYFKRGNYTRFSIDSHLKTKGYINSLKKAFQNTYKNTEKLKHTLSKNNDYFFTCLYYIGGIDEDYLPKDVANMIIPVEKVREIFGGGC